MEKEKKNCVFVFSVQLYLKWRIIGIMHELSRFYDFPQLFKYASNNIQT